MEFMVIHLCGSYICSTVSHVRFVILAYFNDQYIDQAPVPLNIELTKFDRIQILLEIHIAVLSRIVGLS